MCDAMSYVTLRFDAVRFAKKEIQTKKRKIHKLLLLLLLLSAGSAWVHSEGSEGHGVWVRWLVHSDDPRVHTFKASIFDDIAGWFQKHGWHGRVGEAIDWMTGSPSCFVF